ncbi:MAG TPA: PD-(D/E)XK nuclease family protein [Solirubrobacteraceae bacterium]|nr:PD-(D/E)XK nuclease family protein [Solirubrobacteraceae bacterium]
MPITLLSGPANAGKAHVVMDSVRRHLAHGADPLLVVPTRVDAEHYLRELAGEGVAMGVRVAGFDGLIAEAVRRAGIGRPALGGLARERLLQAIAVRCGIPGVSRGYVRALAAIVSELQLLRVSPGRLTEALGRWRAADGEGAATAGLGRLFEAYTRALAEIGYLDEDERALAALDSLRRTPALWGDQPVLFYGFDDLTPLQLDTIETLGRVVGASVTVSLSFEPGRVAFAGRAAAFHTLAPLAPEQLSLGPRSDYYAPASRLSLGHLERNLFEPTAPREAPGEAVRLLEGGGERAELELVAEEIGALLAGGMAPESIAVVLRSTAPQAELLEEILRTAGIPFAFPRKKPFAHTALGRAMIGLLLCVPDEDPTAPRPPATATGPARSGPLPAQARAGEAGAGEVGAGEAGDLLAWLRAPGLLTHPELADRLEIRARRSGASTATQARELWEERHWPLETIDQFASAAALRPSRRGALALIERATRELEFLFAAPRRGAARVLEGEEIDEARALAAGRTALGELRELARAAPELAPSDASELADVLARLEFPSGEHPGPGVVAVLDPLSLRARRVRALFLCGLQEGVFPAPARPQRFLAEEQRRRLAETSGLRLGQQQDALAAERYLLYATLSRPEELLYLSWHLADDDGQPTARSLFVDDVCDLFEEGFSEHRLRRPLGAVGAGGYPEAAGSSAHLGGPRPRDAGGAGEGGLAPLLDERLLAELRGRPWSASSLEAWISCPARWFIERMLRAEDFDPEPEPRARGALAHAALNDTFEGLLRETGVARLTPSRLDLARRLLRSALRERESQHPLSVAPERLPAARRRLTADLERYLEHAALLESPLEPRYLELAFGFPSEDGEGGEEGLPALDLGEGVSLRGRIDRVDVGEGRQAVVYDYKSRSAKPVGKWIADGNLQVALYMRAVEGLLGLEVIGGFYQPLSGADLRARGVLDRDSGLQIECVGGDSREHDYVRELLQEATALAREAAGEAAAGRFPARPRTCRWGGEGCMHPTICRCES